MKKYKVLFCDMDGTLIETASGETFPKGIWDMRFKFDVLDAIKNLSPKVKFMETVGLIIKISISLFNAIALGFVLIMVSRWHRRMEDKLNEIREYTRMVSECNRFIYINELEWLKSAMINEERYEEAAKINKCIEDEYNKLKNGKQ